MARAITASAYMCFAGVVAATLSASASLGCAGDSPLASDTTTVIIPDTTHSVIPPAVVPPAANECASPQSGWIWCDDFESDRTGQYFEYNKSGNRFIRQANAGR